MTRACRPSPAWLRWAVVVCATALSAARPAAGPVQRAVVCPASLPRARPVQRAVGGGHRRLLRPRRHAGRRGDARRARARWSCSGRHHREPDLGLPRDPPGPTPGTSCAADFDRDGKLDIAVATSGATNLSAPPGTGTTFGSREQTEDLGLDPLRLATGDLDHDGIAGPRRRGRGRRQGPRAPGRRGLHVHARRRPRPRRRRRPSPLATSTGTAWGDLAVTQRDAPTAVQIYHGVRRRRRVLAPHPGAAVPVGPARRTSPPPT